MKHVTYIGSDIPKNPTNKDWEKEAFTLFYMLMLQEKKDAKVVTEIYEKFKEKYSKTADPNKHKQLFNELKAELISLKEDENFSRLVIFILLINKSVNAMQNKIMALNAQKSQTEILMRLLPGNTEEYQDELNEYIKSIDKSITKSMNETIRVVRTETSRYVNEKRLDEFKVQGYKFKTTYPVKDNVTGEDSWYYYGEHQVKPINEPFSYEWEGKQRIFQHPPDRPNDRNILIPYIDNLHDNYENK